jgi:hypothetical protein
MSITGAALVPAALLALSVSSPVHCSGPSHGCTCTPAQASAAATKIKGTAGPLAQITEKLEPVVPCSSRAIANALAAGIQRIVLAGLAWRLKERISLGDRTNHPWCHLGSGAR